MEKLELKAPTEPKTLAEKIKDAVSFIKRAEKLALKMQPYHGFWLSFSGGKDSVVILELAKMAGVKLSDIHRLYARLYAAYRRFLLDILNI